MESNREQELRKKLSGLKRKAWLPIVEDGAGAITSSKFSGAPWLSPQEAWPNCSHCGQPMQLFLQLNLAVLPSGRNRGHSGFFSWRRDSPTPLPILEPTSQVRPSAHASWENTVTIRGSLFP